MIFRSNSQVEEDRISDWHLDSERLLSSHLSVAGMTKFLNLWSNVYSVGGSDSSDFMSSLLSSRRDYISGKVFKYDVEKIFKYVFVAIIPEVLVFLVFCLGTSVFNLLSVPYVIVPIIFVGSHRISCWFGEEENQINDFEVQTSKDDDDDAERLYSIGDVVEVRPKAYSFWIRGKIVSDYDNPNIYAIKLVNGVREPNVEVHRMRRPLKRRLRGHRWMLTMLWIYNFVLIFVRVSFQYGELPDTTCEHPAHYTVLLGLQKDVQRACTCDSSNTNGPEVLESQNFTFNVNSATDHWTLVNVRDV